MTTNAHDRPLLNALGVAVALLCAFASPVHGQAFNFGFEEPSSDQSAVPPPGWYFGGSGYEVGLDSVAHTGSQSLRIRNVSAGQFGVATYVLPSTSIPEPGSLVRLSGVIRTEAVLRGYAGLWLRIDGDGRTFFLDNMSGRGATGTQGWAHYSVEAIVPASATQIVFGALLPGDGTAWFDDLSLEFESGAVRVEPAGPLTDRGIENMIAFAQLLGYVRYFHPSDQAIEIDWDRIALEGVQAVEHAEDSQRLAITLDSLFRPIAPTIGIAATGTTPAPQMQSQGATEIVFWRHFGLGGAPLGIYRSERIRYALGDLSLPELPDSVYALVRPSPIVLTGGVQVLLPFGVLADSAGTLPHASGLPAEALSANPMTGDDRATRLAAVATLWNVLQHFYPYFDVVDVDWDQELRVGLRRAAEDRDQCEFLRTLQRMVAALQDGHGRVGGACTPQMVQPPIALDMVEGRPTVVYVSENENNLRLGDVILRVDGRTADAVLSEQRALTSSASPQWSNTLVARTLLGGAPGTYVDLVLERTDGDTVSARIARTESNPLPTSQQAVTEEIEPGIWYVALDRLTEAEFREALPALATASGIVFDLRGYPTSAATGVLLHLIREPSTSAQWHIPVVTYPTQEEMRFEHVRGWDLRPSEPYLSAPRVFLTNGRAISYAESIMGIVEAYELGTIIGEPTAATNGNVNVTSLPGGYTVTWTGMKVLKHDGSQHHGVGIIPDVLAHRSRAGVAAGRDELLERAVTYLRTGE